MYALRKSMLLAALVLISASALATNPPNPCGNHGNNCNPDPPTTSAPVTNEQNQTQDQSQAQGQAQGQVAVATGGAGGNGGTGVGLGGAGGSSNTRIGDVGSTSGAVSGSASRADVSDSGNSASLSSATGGSVGDTSASSGSVSGASNGDQSLSNSNAASADGSGNSTVNVDASDRSGGDHYEAQAIALPTIIPVAPALVGNGVLIAERSACGPRVRKVSERVTQVGKKFNYDLGNDDDIVADEERPYRYWTDQYGVTHVFGHQIITFASQNGLADSKGFSLFGGSTGSGYGGLGASSGASVQRTMLRTQIRECELPLVASADSSGPRTLNLEEDG